MPNPYVIELPHIPMFAASWLTFFTAAVVSIAIQLGFNLKSLRPGSFLSHCFPSHGWRTRSAWMDVLAYGISKLMILLPRLSGFALLVGVAHGIIALLSYFFPSHHTAAIGYWQIIVWSIIVFLFVDFANYLSHFLQHFVPALWELHKVHHSATFLHPLTTERMHPLGDFFDGCVSGIFVGLPAGYLIFEYGFDMIGVLFLIANANTFGTLLVLDSLRHSHFPASFGVFDRILLSPHAHQLHHSSLVEHWDRNFGNKLSVWDWAFKTMRPPRKGETLVYGLGKPEERDYNTIYGFYVEPFVKIFRLVVNHSSASEGAYPAKPFFRRVLWRSPNEMRPTSRLNPSRPGWMADVPAPAFATGAQAIDQSTDLN